MSYWKAILATMVIFACGVITGAMVFKTVAPAPDARPPVAAPVVAASPTPAGPVLQIQRAEFLKRLDKQLDLSAEQHQQISRILKASQERTQPLWTQIAPQMKEELKKVREEIRGVLTPEQRQEFADLMKPRRKPDAAPAAIGKPSRPLEPTTTATNAP